MNEVAIIFVLSLQVTYLHCTPINWMPQIHNSNQWPQLQLPLVQMPQIPPQLHQPSMQLGQLTHGPQMLPIQQEVLEAEQLALQQQMMALQQWQVLQKLSAIHSPVPLAAPPPLLIIIPNPQDLAKGQELTKIRKNENELKHEIGYTNKDSDSVIIENNESDNEIEEIPPKAILLLPKSRFSIGGIISIIPWLPIEVNVPDTIAWGYNGISNWISGIISIIGQRLPLKKPQTTTGSVLKPTDEMAPQSTNIKMLLKQLKTKQEPIMPILVVPLGGTLPPFQIID